MKRMNLSFSVPIQKDKRVEFWVLLFIGMEIIYPLFSSTQISGMFVFLVRIALLFSAIATLLSNSPKSFFIKPLSVYLIWTIYVVFKNLLLGYGLWTSPFQMMSAIIPSSLVVFATVYAYKRNEKQTINAIIIALYIYIMYALISFGQNVLGAEDSERLGGEALNANTIGIRAGLVFFFVIISYLRKKRNLVSTIVLLIVPTIVLFLSGSRTGLVLAFFFLLVFAFRTIKNIGSIFQKILFVVLAVLAVIYIADNTSLGQRMLETTSQSENLSYLQTGTYWDLIGDRGYMYYTAIPYIPQYFWFGMGSGNYLEIVPDAIWVLHSEYLIQILECGIFAALLYYYVYFWIIKNTLSIETDNIIEKDIKKLCVLAFLALIFAGFITRISYYGMYSCVIGYIIYNVYNHQLQMK